ncbi:MAG: hypothetical protein OXM00_06755 [Paracoccaceae bacterium]|nr:hypothetical protein [Paracoccaceae bacterium]
MIDGIPYSQLYKIIETDGHPTKWMPEPDWNIYFYFGPSSKVQVKYLLEHGRGYGSPEMFFDPDDDPKEKYGGSRLRYTIIKRRHNDGSICVPESANVKPSIWVESQKQAAENYNYSHGRIWISYEDKKSNDDWSVPVPGSR